LSEDTVHIAEAEKTISLWADPHLMAVFHSRDAADASVASERGQIVITATTQ
jgi:hypothetical protein